MWKSYLSIAVICSSLWISSGSAAEQTSATTEIGGVLQTWNPGSGYLIVSDTRYQLSNDVLIVSDTGATLSASALDDGIDVLMVESEGLITQITVMSSNHEGSIPN